MSKEVKLTLQVNGKDIPISGDITHKYNGKGDLTVTFQAGTTRLDKMELKFENLNYINAEK